MSSVRRTIRDEVHSGTICPQMMRALEAPWRRTAAMKSAWRTVMVSARAMRAYGGHAVIAIAMMAFSMPGPSAATNASARIRRGNARNTSVMRISTVSSQPPT